MATTQKNNGTLFIVPTPIGNLEDITLRALRILKEVDQICAEDTRHTRKLLTHFGISTPLLSYYREKEEERSRVILELLEKGQDIALVSDAGTPAISDPGSILVSHAHKRGFRVVPLPGASAVTTAMSAAGISSDSFLFLGFAPSKKGQRIKFLSSLTNCEYPFILYESPRRVTQLLEDALQIFGDRDAFWARELTKAFEDLRRGTISSLLEESEDTNRGEFVIIICPGAKDNVTGETLEDLLVWYRDNTDLSLKDVSKKLSSDLGLSRSKIYQQALELWKQGSE